MIKATGISKRFGSVQAVSNLDLDVPRGVVCGLLGANGAGKTTTLRMITGILSSDSGSLEVLGCSMPAARRDALRRIGYLPEAAPSNPEMRVVEFLRFRARLLGLDRSQAKRDVANAIDDCDLGTVSRRLIGQLSKGYRQRVGLAAALVGTPELLVLDEPEEEVVHEEEGAPVTLGDRLDRARWLSSGLALLVVVFLVSWFAGKGLALNLDIVNWTLLAAGLLLADSPRHYLALITDASRSLGPIVLQYPLYAGIVALMTKTALADLLADGFVAIASPDTLGFWAFVSGGVLNFFIPSGGGQWAVQGPIFLEAARELGVASRAVVLGVAYGDQWTNLVQPFWALPLLAIAGLPARAIMGYCFVAFVAAGLCLGGGLLVVGAG